jgi:methionyl-tRNA formyltransferase
MNNDKIKIIFFGSGTFGLPTLKSLLNNDNFIIKAIVTQPDKASGRGLKIIDSPIKKIAVEKNIPLLQPASLQDLLLPDNIDLLIVISYAKILPQPILAHAKYGALNLHASLLPKYRGAACVQAPILNGDKNTGVTIIKMDNGIDTGDILAYRDIPLDKKENYGSLYEKLSKLGAEIFPDIILKYFNQQLSLRRQDDMLAGYVKKITKNDGRIDWRNTAEYLERFIRTMHPWPGAWSLWENKKIKIIAADYLQEKNDYEAGQIFYTDNKLKIKCLSDCLLITELQLEGKKPATPENLLHGYPHLKTAKLI